MTKEIFKIIKLACQSSAINLNKLKVLVRFQSQGQAQEISVGRQSVLFIWSETDEIGLMSVIIICICIRMVYDRSVMHS